MFYRALKKCRFDQDYAAGELIPGGVILRPKDLIEMKAIEAVTDIKEAAGKLAERVAEELDEAFKIFPTGEKPQAEEHPQQAAEDDENSPAETTGETKNEAAAQPTEPTRAQLLSKKKDELLTMAKELNLPVDDSFTKVQIVEAITLKKKAV